MKKPFFPLSKTKLLCLWFIAHCGLFLALGLSVPLFGPVRINASLFDILPPSRGIKTVARADAVLGERSGRQVVILAGSADFVEARDGAAELYQALRGGAEGNSPVFESLNLWVDESYLNRLRDYLYEYRFMLLDAADRKNMENGGDGIAVDALASVYGAFSMASLDRLEGDPFLLAERGMRHFLSVSALSGGKLSPRDDVLAAQYEGNWYVMLRGSLSPAGVALTNRNSAVQKIYAAGSAIAGERPGLRFYYSGVPFHSYESSSSAQREISLISTVSLIAVLAIFLFVFRSPVPVLSSAAAIGCSILTALSAALLVFREVHVLTFVFGTTLIGTCVDYSIHYFIHRRGLPAEKTGAEIRSLIFRGIALSFVSTAICFAALFSAPFIILKQFAVFSLAGLSSSFLSVMCVYPLLWNGQSLFRAHQRDDEGKRRRLFAGNRVANLPNKVNFPFLRGKRKLLMLLSMLAALSVTLAFNHSRVRIDNKLGDLYRMPQTLAKSERINALAINHGSMSWYFIVSGSEPEEVLQKEEALCSALDGEIAAGRLISYLATSLFIPSKKTQTESYRAAEKLLPLLEAQFANLGFPADAAEQYRAEFAAACGKYIIPGGDNFPAELAANLWTGSVGGKYFSCVMPLHAKNETPFRTMAETLDGVFFVNKVSDTGDELNRLTGIMLLLFLAAFVLIAVMVRCFYPWGTTLRICAVPLSLVLCVLAVLSILNISLGFFTVAGLLLVFGLGMDYIFYSMEAVKKSGGTEKTLAARAIFLSFATTALSFGALALSGFVPVHIFGITVFSGLCAAYVSAVLVTPDKE